MSVGEFNLKDFLRRFNIMIYTGDPEGDWLLIEDEVRDLLKAKVIDKEEFSVVMNAIEKRKELFK
ncbi:YqgQ family protein [Brevibacillus daliensis]|uniref:YqgQ family protein n=1 Tax=Brevibacillus daliensis TaxID=2892995 RepID=UPI001E2A9EBC|nr:YqgQ family protein [Brevibacillus daliensis]